MSYEEILREKYKGKICLVTGGSGFLGSHLCSYLKKLGAIVLQVGSKRADLCIEKQVKNVFDYYAPFLGIYVPTKFDYIFHLAAFQGAGEFTLKYPAEQFHKNCLIHTNVLEAWKKYQPQARFVAMGSTCQYPAKDILYEEDYMSGPLHPSVETYGLTRCVLTQGVKAYKQQHGLKGTTTVLATLYGPGDSFDLSKSHVVSSLIRKFVEAHKNHSPEVEIWGDGTQMRELIFVEDQVIGILLCADSDRDIINVGSGEFGEITIRHLAEVIKELIGFEGKLQYNSERFVGVLRKRLNIDKAIAEHQWTHIEPMTSLRDGLQKTIEWYQNQ